MDTFDKREYLLGRQIEMLEGKTEQNETLLALIHFESCCANGGLSCFAEDFDGYDLSIIENFAKEEQFETVEHMISTLKAFIKKYGNGLPDCLTDSEYDELSKYDDEFFEINDTFTDKLYEKIIGII